MPPTTSDPRKRPQSSLPSTSVASSSSCSDEFVPSTSSHSPVPSTSQALPSTSRDNRYDPYSQSGRPKSASGPARAESKPKPPAPYNTYRYRTEFTPQQLVGYINSSSSSNSGSNQRYSSSSSSSAARRGRGGKDYQHPRCKRCVTTPILERKCIQADPWAQNEEDSEPEPDASDDDQPNDLSISSVQSLDSLYKVSASTKGYEMLDREDDEDDED
ncbi:hypothetical protein JCM5353_003227 [Sporobolomyces roseus]